MEILEQCKLKTKIRSKIKNINYLVILEIKIEIILRTETLKDWKIKIDFKKEIMKIRKEEIIVIFRKKKEQEVK
jgi:hypothetical protein